MSNQISTTVQEAIAVVEVANPPVNALSLEVRQGLQDAIRSATADPEVAAVVIYGAGRTFIAGADIKGFGKAPTGPVLRELIDEIEASEKPVVVALHGTVLGGGLEVAMGCHYRIADPKTKLGLPEVSLGILPGAGGTQRLPRLVPVEKSIAMITKGAPISAAEALELGLIDKLADGDDIRAAGISYAQELIAAGAQPRRTTELPCQASTPELFDAARAKLAKSARGQMAPIRCVDAIEGAATLPYAEGLEQERLLITELMASDQRVALVHAFFSERQVAKVPEIKGVAPRAFDTIGVIGGGTMGAGITVSALLSGLDVTIIERDQEAVDRAFKTVSKILQGSVKRGKLSDAKYDAILTHKFRASDDHGALSEADIVIEAVFETMDVKKDVFGQLDAVCKPGAILASNTSFLDINEIAAATKRPQDVIGLHFFSPAHVMRLLEVVVGEKTEPEVTATGFALAKKLRKIAVRSGVCDGFIGNRIAMQTRKALDGVTLSGASPSEVDAALEGFGAAMGPFAVGDLAGLDIGWANRKRFGGTQDPREVYGIVADQLCEEGNFGRKTGKGFYIHGDGGATPNPEALEYLAAARSNLGVTPRDIDTDEIVDRYMAAMVNEAARIVEEGIALRPLDVDVTLINGYGFPRWRGGPMQYADTVGPEKILNNIKSYAAEDATLWQPAALLERLVAEGKNFSSLNV